MKNIVMTFVCFCGLTGFSFAGDCTHGFCNRPVGRVLSATKTTVKRVVTAPRKIVSWCVNGKCNKTR